MIELNGISGGSPIGFMAAIGLLRVLSEDLEVSARLSWRGGTAVLEGVESREELLAMLAKQMDGRFEALEWNWAPTAKRASPQEYAAACRAARGNRRALAFLSAFATDTVLRDDGYVYPTLLDFTSGKQKLIAGLRKLAGELSQESEAIKSYANALFGGPYEKQSSYGWDPAGVRQHAYEAQAPTRSPPPGKRGLVWLAAESLALHPVLPAGGRVRTTGCEQNNDGEQTYYWPLWESAFLSLTEVRMLRALDLCALSRRVGVSSIWLSCFGKSGDYGVLMPGRRIV